MRDVTFQLTPAAVVSGRILDASGEPMVGVRVELLPAGYDATGRRIALPLARSGTNDRGEYRLFNVEPGRYYLRASVSRSVLIQQGLARAAEIARNAPDDERRYVPTYFPGVSDITRATVFEIHSGDDRARMDMTNGAETGAMARCARHSVAIQGRLPEYQPLIPADSSF